MKKERFLAGILFVGMALVGCHENNNQNTQAVRQEMRSREIVHATPIQIVERANLMGDSLIWRAETRWIQSKKQFPDTACQVLFSRLQMEIKEKYQAEIQLIPFYSKSISQAKTKVEKEILDAYLYNRDQGLALEPNLQKDGEKEFLFTRAFILPKELKGCYSVDNQVNSGDTLGIWSVRILKKQVILSFVEKY